MSHLRHSNQLHHQQLLRLRRPSPLPYGCQTASRLAASASATLQPSSSRSSRSAPFSSSARLPHLPPCPSASSSSSLALGGSHLPFPRLSGSERALVHPYPPTSLPHSHATLLASAPPTSTSPTLGLRSSPPSGSRSPSPNLASSSSPGSSSPTPLPPSAPPPLCSLAPSSASLPMA